MQHALEQQRPPPDAAQPVDVLPVQRRIQHARDVGRERQNVLALLAHVVGESERRARHAQRPGQRAGDVEHAAPGDAGRDHEAVHQIALALAQHLVVDGQDQRPIAGGLRPLGERPGEAAVAIHEVLEPQPARDFAGEVLDRDGRAVAHDVDRAGGGGGARGRHLAARPEHAGQPGRTDDHRQRQPLAEQFDRLVAGAGAVQGGRQEFPVGESRLVALPGDLVLGAAVAEIEHHARQAPPGELAQRRDAVPVPLQTTSIQRHRSAHPATNLSDRQLAWRATSAHFIFQS